MKGNYYLYKINEDGTASIYGKFPSLQMATMSANLLMINDICFIVNEDVTKMYFYEDDSGWDYDILTEDGRKEFLQAYQNPLDYK